TTPPHPSNVPYVHPSTPPPHPTYPQNPNTFYHHHQFQVIINPSPHNIQQLYLQSFKPLPIHPLKHHIPFLQHNS
ncbi:glycine--tRNA ligase subunit alpha, partial [Bacillus sp. WP8]|uniref:glycine--tRNA ligase subunit alpha n=1 Tax=Bacillus sp. WP8 TaxID=756828 RepID=UPI0011A200C9